MARHKKIEAPVIEVSDGGLDNQGRRRFTLALENQEPSATLQPGDEWRVTFTESITEVRFKFPKPVKTMTGAEWLEIGRVNGWITFS